MDILGIIGGTALPTLSGLENPQQQTIATPYGEPSAPVLRAKLNKVELAFLPRHGQQHTIAPHRINYRANIYALHACGVKHILSLASVGGIGKKYAPGRLLVPQQLIDYTYGREQSFFTDAFAVTKHIDFTEPYSATLRQTILTAAAEHNISLLDGGVYGVTQGPRLETAAEIHRLKRDGCDVVGMTGMPEAALARELEIDYACCAIVVNWAAGLSSQVITLEDIQSVIHDSAEQLADLIRAVVDFSSQTNCHKN